jgi:arylsulfatase A-like enzyme
MRQQQVRTSPKSKGTKGKNVLYLVVDDLRPDLEAYGQNFTHNPNIKKLADAGIVFDNAYCQIAVQVPLSFSVSTKLEPTRPLPTAAEHML